MRAVILAGGRGARLAPFTAVIPKPLLPVDGRPILEIVVRQLVHSGFDHITLTLGYMSDYFRVFLSQHRSLSQLARIDFVEETQPTGTAGSLRSVPGLDDTFLVMNGDLLTNLDYRAQLEYHRAQQSWLTIGAHRKIVNIDLGILETDQHNMLTGYREKPTLAYQVSMGIYIYEPQVLDWITPGEYLDFPDLVLRLLAAKKKVVAYTNDACWLDLGRYEDLKHASDIFIERRHEFLPQDENAGPTKQAA